MRAALSGDGSPAGFEFSTAVGSITRSLGWGEVKDGVERQAVEGLAVELAFPTREAFVHKQTSIVGCLGCDVRESSCTAQPICRFGPFPQTCRGNGR